MLKQRLYIKILIVVQGFKGGIDSFVNLSISQMYTKKAL